MLASVSGAHGAFREGPEVIAAPSIPKASPLNVTPLRSLSLPNLPPQILETVGGLALSGRDILIVGHTDVFGPRLLNQSLALQYASITAYRLSEKLNIDLSRFHCGTAGELPEKGESGVSVYAADPKPPGEVEPPSTVAVLSPSPGGETAPEFIALWENDAKTVYWGREDSGKISLWRLSTPSTPFSMPYPARTAKIALGAEFGDDQGVGENAWPVPQPEPTMTLGIQSLETGWAVITGKVGPGSRDVYVWAGGIPYPAPLEGGRFSVAVVRYGQETPVYAQAVDAKGRVVAGPLLKLPPNPEGDPKVLAVLTWQGEDTDLDLHGWRGEGHTQPQDPDPAMSGTAARGVRLLFDGDGRSRASAIWADDDRDLEIEVRAFSDLGGGAKAMLYVVTDVGDPIMRRGRIIGPRNIEGDYMWSRWGAFSLRGKK